MATRLKWIFGVLFAYSVWFVLLFSPILFGAKLFPSDGQLAAFFAPVTPWNPLALAGDPSLGEPHLQQLYPLRWVFAALPKEIGFNLFLTFSYVLASSFTFGYSYTLTKSVSASLLGGLIFGTSGFMIGHLGHTGVVPAAAWLPLVVWTFELLRRAPSARWTVIGVISVAMVIVGGHPQVFAYVLCVALAYALFLGVGASIGWKRYVGLCFLIIGMGAALAAPHILPMLELAEHSMRSTLTFDAFKEYSLPLRQIPMLLFPYLFGGAFITDFPSYFGLWNPSEITGYVGLTSVTLAAIGAWCERRQPIVLFWLGIAIVALILALGDATPLLRVTYYMPVIGKLRAPARHFLEMAFAISVLAAIGMNVVRRYAQGVRAAAACALTITLIVLLLSLLVVAVSFDDLRAMASSKETRLGTAYLTHALLVPILIFLASALALVYWINNVTNRFRQWLVVATIALDLANFGRLSEWRYGLPSTALVTPPFAERYALELNRENQRFMSMLGWQEPVLPFSTMMSQVYRIPSVGGYGPLLLQRYAALSMVTNGGWINPGVLSPADRAPDLLAARYIAIPRLRANSVEAADGKMRWSEKDFSLRLGNGCGNAAGLANTRIELTMPQQVDRIGIVSRTACSTGLIQDDEIARLTLTATNGSSATHALRAGRDTAEWAIDCEDVGPITKHKRAAVFDSWDNVRTGQITCKGHRFVSEVEIAAGRYKDIAIEWLASAPNVVDISKITLFDSANARAYTLSEQDVLLGDKSRFERVEDFETTAVFRNKRALPRAWLVSEVVSARDEQILAAIRSSTLPDGRPYDPRDTALVEEPYSLLEARGSQSVDIVELGDDRITLLVNSQNNAFLVLSDVHYPGWSAELDHKEVKLFRANYALRGIAVPPGKHTVVFIYRPRWFYVGLGLAGFSVFVSCLIGLYGWRRGLRGKL